MEHIRIFGFVRTTDDVRTYKRSQEIKSFEERCLNKFRYSNLSTLRGTVEEEVAKISDRMSAMGSEILSMKEEIKRNQIEIKQNVRKYTKSITEDFPRLMKNRSDEQNTLFERTQTSIQEHKVPAFHQIAKIPGKEENPTDENITVNPVKLIQEENLLVSFSDVIHGDNEEEFARIQKTREEAGYQNMLSRSAIYPISDIQRLQVPNDMVPWQVEMKYEPPKHTALLLAASLKWIDEQILNEDSSSFKFNDMDGNDAVGNINRRSYLNGYQVINGIPRNPVGRTGLTGRGILGRYGPNHMCTAIFTRVQCVGKNLEALVMPAKNKKGLAFPQGANEDCGMTDLMTSLCKEIEKWKKQEEYGTVEKEYGGEEEEEEEDDSLSKHLREAIKFMKKFQELFQCKIKDFNCEDTCMLGWGYRFCEKRMLIKSGMTEKEAAKFMKTFDNIYKSGLTEEDEQSMDVFGKIYENQYIDEEADKFLETLGKIYKNKMKGAKGADRAMLGWTNGLFHKGTLVKIGMSRREAEKYMEKFDKIVQNKQKIFEGYVDSEFNTDNAWLETVVYNFHDDQNIIKKFLLAKNNHGMHWRKISEIEKLGATEGLPVQLQDWLRKVSNLRQ